MRSIVAASTALFVICQVPAASITAAPPANIVFVMADDLGWVDTSVSSATLMHESDFYETPALESLAGQGMSFTHGYAGPICAPTRASILTGQYPGRSSNPVFTVGDLNNGNNGGSSSLLTGTQNGLSTGEDELPGNTTTVADVLQVAGYTTAHFGKYQIGHANTSNGPLAQGFDFNYGGTHIGAGGGGGYHAAQSGGQWEFPGEFAGPDLDAYAAPYTQDYIDTNISPFSSGSSAQSLLGTPKHLTDATTDAAIDFMEGHKDDPFFVHLSHFAVHIPTGVNQARDDLLAKYQTKNSTSPSQMGHNSPSYAAMVEGVDQSVGRLVDYLNSTPDPRNSGHMLADNTLLVFYSDNGGSEDPRGDTDNGPLTGQKGMLGEGGVRVPLIISMPGTVPAGTVTDTAVNSVDFFPTFLDLAQANPPSPAVHPLDGASLLPVLQDATADLSRDAIFWHYPGYDLSNARNQKPQSSLYSAEGNNEWKLYYNYETQDWELYDLAVDLEEFVNLAELQGTVVDSLSSILIEWLDGIDAPLATVSQGAGPILLVANGMSYANGTASSHSNEVLVFESGDELPVFQSVSPWLVGDFDLNNIVDVNDWWVLRGNLLATMDSQSPGEAILLGDLNSDQRIDGRDFSLFKDAYDASRFPGAFNQLTAVPEPSCLTYLSLAAIVAVFCQWRKETRIIRPLN